MILDGRVTVDGELVTQLGSKADPLTQEIAVDGRCITLPDETHILALHKPAGYLSTREDDRERPTVMQFVAPDLRGLVYPVGRLDLNSTGLLLLTNDGALTYRLTHPSYHVPKTYEVDVERSVTDAEVKSLREGVVTADGLTAPAEVTRDPHNARHLRIVLYEGRKRQIRRMLQALNNGVVRLHRIAFGPLEIGDLGEGEARELSASELSALRNAVGIDG